MTGAREARTGSAKTTAPGGSEGATPSYTSSVNKLFLYLMLGGKYVSTVSTLIIFANVHSYNMFLHIEIGGIFFSSLKEHFQSQPTCFINICSFIFN